LLLEEQEGSVNFKFGVLYARPGQNSDDEMFSNGEWIVHILRTFDLMKGKLNINGTCMEASLQDAFSFHADYTANNLP
jgi:hypothetical protein